MLRRPAPPVGKRGLPRADLQRSAAKPEENLDELNDAEIMEMAGNLQNGVPFATRCSTAPRKRKSRPCWHSRSMPESGQMVLFDGRTGEQFERPVTVGYMHFLKLHHLVDDKMHARSTGPYSLGHPAAAGRQGAVRRPALRRNGSLGLEAYGASYVLQEMLTVKSDDVNGRTKVYENIVKGEHKIDAGMPESFNVLVKEIRSLAIDIDLERY